MVDKEKRRNHYNFEMPQNAESELPINPQAAQDINKALKRGELMNILKDQALFTSFMIDNIFWSPAHLVRELKEFGFRNQAKIYGTAFVVFPLVTAAAAYFSGETIVSATLNGLGAWATEGMFLATPQRNTLMLRRKTHS